MVASDICTWACAAEYWALTTSFWVRNASSLAWSFCWLSVSCSYRRVDRADLVLDGLLALQRRAREILITRAQRLARLPVELDDLLAQAVLLVLQPLARGRHLGNPVLDVRHQLELLLIAVVQRLRRILGAIHRRRGLRLHQGAQPSPKSGHRISSRPAPSDTGP